MRGSRALLLVALAALACQPMRQRVPDQKPGSVAPPRRPNVIIVLTDDQGYGDLSVHGNPVLRTPHLDRFHGESVRFTDFHSAPMCTPTRGQLLTGRDALANGASNVNSGRSLIRQGIPTMAEILAAAGYRTGQFGKWHLGHNYPHRPQDRGFQESLFFPASHISSAPDHWTNDYFDDVYWQNGQKKRFKGYCTDVFFQQAMSWMDRVAAAGEAFFTYLPLNAPHSPHFVPQKFRDPYLGKDLTHPEASFFGMIANIDENMARLDQWLRRKGLWQDTIVIFATDNGTGIGQRVFDGGMRDRKWSLYEGGHRVPLFLRWPGGNLRPPGDVDGLTQMQDVLPTILDLAGVPAPAGVRFDGVSLAAPLRDPGARVPDRTLVVQYGGSNESLSVRPQRGEAAVLWRRWRLVRGSELYNLETDPRQAHDVIAQHGDIASRLGQHYDAWWAAVEPGLDEPVRITVGADAENPSMLSTPEWWNVPIDQSRRVREGAAKNGGWNLSVQRQGSYLITLRRWPEEADTAISSGMPSYKGVDGVFAEGKALPVAEARLRVAGFDARRPVSADDKAVAFRVDLPRGPVELQTWFYDAQGQELAGAYYVYVRRETSRPQSRRSVSGALSPELASRVSDSGSGPRPAR